MPAQKIPMVNF